MTTDETARLVNAIVSTWPAGVKGHVWTDALAPLDREHARAAYTELRDHDERPPSIARFLATYHAKRTADAGDHGRPSNCELCDGTGWIESPPERAHRASVCTPRPAVVCTCNPTDETPCNCKLAPAVECHCHAVEPCRCSAGRRATDVHRSIVEHNDRTRRTDLLEGDPPPDTLRHWSEREPDPELF